MQAYENLKNLFGDLHNHCGISYGHGSLEEALLNAREQLDFCSVTGHALWPDMPEPDADIQHIVDFHLEGFAHLRQVWPKVQQITEEFHQDGKFVTFLSFEMHSCQDGDYTIIYKDSQGGILEVSGLAELRGKLGDLKSRGVEAIAFPHHIAYHRGQRGINWDSYTEEFSPIVEIISMHGCSEADECTRPFLHVMGPSDHESTMQYGLEQGNFFGVIGSTDHHSAHPGSYGHGRTGIWARENSRADIWEALTAHRTYALTGDRIALEFAVNDQPMGSILPAFKERRIAFHVVGGAPIDYVDILKNGELLRRFSRSDAQYALDEDLIHTRLYLEVGWGKRNQRVDWDVEFGISGGEIISIEPRFRGFEIVSPVEKSLDVPSYYFSHWDNIDELTVKFNTSTFGNPTNTTPATQGICLHAALPRSSTITYVINGNKNEIPLSSLLEGARSGRLGKISSPAYRLHRAPLRWEFDWQGEFLDSVLEDGGGDIYYARVRQMNDQWAWSSPVKVG